MGNGREKETWVTVIAKLIILSITKAISHTALVLGALALELTWKKINISVAKIFPSAQLGFILLLLFSFSCYFPVICLMIRIHFNKTVF